MVAVQKPPATDFTVARAAAPARLPRRPLPPSVGTVPRRRPAPAPFPPLGFVAAGGTAVLRVAGDGLLNVADEIAYATLDRADRLAARSGPLTYLGLAPSTAARVAYSAGSDLAHGLIAGS